MSDEILNRQLELELYKFKFAIVIGVGGIGSWAALNLALSGCVDELIIIDPDKIESSNLNRTPFRLSDVGYYKVDALKYMILERRTTVNIRNIRAKTNIQMADEFRTLLGINHNIKYTDDPTKFIEPSSFIIDCRDDVYDDFYSIPVKYYKVGYDGFSITIDGNPRNTAVWGRANGYRNVPSFVCPAQLAANIVVSDILSCNPMFCEEPERFNITDNAPYDYAGRINTVVTFDSRKIPEMISNSATERING